MTDVTSLEEIVWQCRENIVRNFDENPKAATLVAFDAVTTLLVAAVEELRGIRQSVGSQRGSDA